jgi:diguanylate cyclase (GGDEF)-like protein
MTTIEGYLDSATVILFGLFVKLLLASLFFVFWLKSRQAIWFLWWGMALLFGALAAGNVILRGFEPDLFGLGITTAALVASFGCCWQGARAFEHRAPLWFPLLALPALCLAFSLVPDFFAHTAYRLIFSSILLALMNALTAVEFWRGRDEGLMSRWMIIALFASFSLFFAVRIALVGIAPFPFGALPMEATWMAVFNMTMFFHTIILVVLLVALTKERLELEQRVASYTDPLTGALNRRALAIRGQQLLSRHERDRHELCALFLDIDGFKPLSDRLGHAGGDRILKRFVEIVQENIRPADFLFRIGGDEFFCLLPQTITEQGYWMAERIRREIEAATFVEGGSQIKTTVSIGVASTTAARYDLDALLREADGAACAAKRRRNRVVTAETNEHAIARPVALSTDRTG